MTIQEYTNYINLVKTVITRQTIDYYDMETKTRKTIINNLDLSQVHEDLRRIDYASNYNKSMDDRLEKYKMIPFALIYYNILAKYSRIPSIDVYVNSYLDEYCVKIEHARYTFKNEYVISDSNIVFDYDALKSRMLRAYNSFNREIELLLKYFKYTNDTAWYDSVRDLNGVDLIVKRDNKEFWIREAVKTNRSEQFVQKKNSRHVGNYAQYPYCFTIYADMNRGGNTDKYGEIYVYNDQTVTSILTNINNLLNYVY